MLLVDKALLNAFLGCTAAPLREGNERKRQGVESGGWRKMSREGKEARWREAGQGRAEASRELKWVMERGGEDWKEGG